MTTQTQQGSQTTIVIAEDSQAPALRSAGGLQTVNAGGAPVYDDRTQSLALPLPHADNELEDDVYRLRDALSSLDANAADQDEAIETLRATAEDHETRVSQLERDSAALDEDVRGLTESKADGADTSAALSALEARAQRDEADIATKADATETAAAVAGVIQAAAEHDASDTAHAALIKRVTMGDLSPVIGVALVETGSGSGLWCNVDAEGRIITPPKRYFDFHPVYSALTDRVLVDGQVMQRHKKFYYKTLTLPSGELQGKHARLIAPERLDGFQPFPSFMRNGAEIDFWYCGTYDATDDGGTPKKLGSRPGRVPFVNVNFPTMQSYCQNRNTGGVTGFDMWDIYQASELQLLALIEYACPDLQGLIGRGRVDTSSANYVDADDVARAAYRGHVGLWGNVWRMVAGIDVTTSGTVRVWNVNGNRQWVDTGFVLPAYDGTNMAYVQTFKTGQGNGWDFDILFLPATTTTALLSATLPDGFWGRYGGAGNVLYLGGHWAWGSGAGLFCQTMSIPASYAYANIGCRLAKA